MQSQVLSYPPPFPQQNILYVKVSTTLTNGVTPGGVDGWELVGERTVVTDVGAGGADQDAVVNPVVGSNADTQQLTFTDAEVGAILNEHRQALS